MTIPLPIHHTSQLMKNCDRPWIKTGICTVVISAISGALFAQEPPAIEWAYTHGDLVELFSVRELADGGFIATGIVYPDSAANANILLLRLSSTGAFLWEATAGGLDGDVARAVRPTPDGGFIVAGHTFSSELDGYHAMSDGYVVKFDSVGVVEWAKCLGGSSGDGLNAVELASDGGYLVAGYTYSVNGDLSGDPAQYNDIWVTRLNGEGEPLWSRSLGGVAWESAWAMDQTADESTVVIGITYSNDGDVDGNHSAEVGDMWFIKLDGAGTLDSQHCFGGTEGDVGTCLQQTPDGGYVLIGSTYSNDGDVSSAHGDRDVWILKLDEQEQILWQRCVGGSDSDEAWSVRQTLDGGYIAAGMTYSDDGDLTGHDCLDSTWIVKFDGEGLLQWQMCLNIDSDNPEAMIEQVSDGGYVLVHGGGEVFKLEGEGGAGLQEVPFRGLGFEMAPNPCAGMLTISGGSSQASIVIADLQGRRLLEPRSAGSRTSIDLSHWPRGVYLVTLRSPGGSMSKRLVLE